MQRRNMFGMRKSLNVLFACLSPGHFLLTYLLLDLIKHSTPARVVVVASVAHTWTGLRLDDINSERNYDAMKAYGQSKLANVLFARSLAKQLQGEMKGIDAYASTKDSFITDLVLTLSHKSVF